MLLYDNNFCYSCEGKEKEKRKKKKKQIEGKDKN